MAGRASCTVAASGLGQTITSNARPATREYSGDESQQRQQDYAERDTSAARSFAPAAGITHKGVAFTGGGTVNLTHRLGKTPQGWIVVRVFGGANQVYEAANPTPDKTLYLVNPSGSPITLDILVF